MKMLVSKGEFAELAALRDREDELTTGEIISEYTRIVGAVRTRIILKAAFKKEKVCLSISGGK